MIPLREQLIRFVAELRAAGIRVSVAESIDAMNAVAAVGLDRVRMREALAAALIKDEADRIRFDEIFSNFFAAPAGEPKGRRHPEHRGQAESAGSGRGQPGEMPQSVKPAEKIPPRRESSAKAESEARRQEIRTPGSRSQPESAKAKPPPGRAEPPRAGSENHHERHSTGRDDGAEAGRLARIREIERTPFDAYTDLTFDEARDTLGLLERRFRARLGRRMRLARRGRIDIRRTIRAAIQRGGALADLRFRARRPRHVDLVVLADISGSVRYAAELTLALVAGARNCFHRVRSFVYIDRPVEAGLEQGYLAAEAPIDFYARSDFGRVLAELSERRGELFTRQTVVVIIGDARNNRRPARAELLREIARTVRAIVWLNPEETSRWNTGDSAIAQYARAVTELHPARNLRELERALARAA